MSVATLLDYIQRRLFQYVGPIFMCIGTISSTLNLMVFTKNPLRKNPCTICLIALNIINFISPYLTFLGLILEVGYGFDVSSTNLLFCRSKYYTGFVLASWHSSCLILASIDRMLVTSRNAGTRQRSTCRLVIISIISIFLFWMIFHIHAWMLVKILQIGPNYSVCYYEPGVYTSLVTYYTLVISGTLPPVLMGIFGCWTIRNIRQIHHTAHQSSTRMSTIIVIRPAQLQAKDRQLIRMLLVEIVTYIIFKFPVTIVYIYEEITRNISKNEEQRMIEKSILQIVYFLYFVENSIGCYTNILVSKTFRTELKHLFVSVRLFCT
ncbi:hypothetical protein I4U23_023397 [Adineta vaga]|nr:hypothetical protein I4U23_023397 [Adineta vaga]